MVLRFVTGPAPLSVTLPPVFPPEHCEFEGTLGMTTKNLCFRFDQSEADFIPDVIGEFHRSTKRIFDAGQPEAPT